jgi:hypothetical protein
VTRDFMKLKLYAEHLGYKVEQIPTRQFRKMFPPKVLGACNPFEKTIVLSKELKGERLLYAFAHEIGHALDHQNDPASSEEYGFHFHLAHVCDSWGRERFPETEEVFRRQEEKAFAYGEIVLDELHIEVSDEVREQFEH